MAFSWFKNLPLIGFDKKSDVKENPSVTELQVHDDDAATVIIEGALGTYVDNIEEKLLNTNILIREWRRLATIPEVEDSIDIIVNDIVSSNDDQDPVTLNLDDVKVSDKIKKRLTEEFDRVLELLDFKKQSYEIVKRWYIDGRYPIHVIIDEKNKKNGIYKLSYVDPSNIEKVKEVVTTRDANNVIHTKLTKSYFVYSPYRTNYSFCNRSRSIQNTNLAITDESIVYSHSGILSIDSRYIWSNLEVARKTINNLTSMTDSMVVNRYTRAPERLVFTVDTTGMTPQKAEAHIKKLQERTKNKIVYDTNTGEVGNPSVHAGSQKRVMNLLQDFWLPSGSSGSTTITPLPNATNTSDIDDINMIKEQADKALRVPSSRKNGDGIVIGGQSEGIIREEHRFSKFINRQRNRIAETMLAPILKRQCILTNVCTESDWDRLFKNKIKYIFTADSYLKQREELNKINEQISITEDANNLVGIYLSKDTVYKKVLNYTDDDIKQEYEKMAKEKSAGIISEPNSE